jgi:hypothetical protein
MPHPNNSPWRPAVSGEDRAEAAADALDLIRQRAMRATLLPMPLLILAGCATMTASFG